MLHSRVTWLKYINKLETLYKTYWLKFQFGVIWGHRGLKVIFSKNVSSPRDNIALSCDSCICISWLPSTKLISSNFNLGSFGVIGVKRSFSLKTLLLSQIIWHCHVNFAYASAIYPLQNLLAQIWIPGHLGSQRSKGHFHQKRFFSYSVHCVVTWLMYINTLETLYSNYCLKFWYGVLWGRWGQNYDFTFFYTMFYNCNKIIGLIIGLN